MKQLKKVGKLLFSMKTAIAILILLIVACTVGSLIPQGELDAYYTGYCPEKVGMLILLLGLNDVFHCWWFIVLTVFLCVNLLGCNLLHFPGLWKRTREGFSLEKRLKAWNGTPDAVVKGEPEKLFEKLGFRNVQTSTGSDGVNYRYAVRNKAGLWGAWMTHLGMLVILLGFGLGQMFTVKYTVYGVPGETKPIADTGYQLTIDDFRITLREDETVEQYTATLTVTNPATGESGSGEASVNHPMNLFGMKLYQNSTGWAATVEVTKDGEVIQEEILCAGEHLAVKNQEELVVAYNAFYPDFVMGANGMPATASPEVNNPAYLYTLYYQGGVLGMNVLPQGQIIDVQPYTIRFSNPQQYTLIQIKHDPFTWLTMIGGILILVALMLAFYLRTEELWAVEQADGSWLVAGYSRKGGILFHDTIVEKAERL